MSTNMGADAPEATDAGLRLVVPGRKRPAASGWEWVARGWTLFRMAPVMWIVAIVALFVIVLASSFVPIIGSLAFQVVAPVFAAGYVAACRALEREGEFDIEHLLAGFSRRFGKLALVGLLYTLGMVALLVVFALFVGFPVVAGMLGKHPELVAGALASSILWFLLGLLVVLLLALPLVAAYWFAPALVYMHDMDPVAAMKASCKACFRNFGSFFVYSLVAFAGLILAMIPFFLGMFVWVPLAVTSSYAAYRDIFTDDVAIADTATPVVPAA